MDAEEADRESKLKELLDKHNASLTAEFVPHSLSRNKDSDPCLNWKIALRSNNVALYTTDYSAGIGHIPGNLNYQRSKTIDGAHQIRLICESGKASEFNNGHVSLSYDVHKWLGLNRWQGVLEPDFTNVWFSLTCDADALNYINFEDWASCFGYDEDSRKAEQLYIACSEIARAMYSLFGNDLPKLQEIFQGY